VQRLILPTLAVAVSTPRTRVITIGLGAHAFPFHPGQAVFAGLADGTLKRPYSIASSPGQAERARAIELLVQIDDHQPPDPHLERAAPGTLLRVEGPFGSFGLVETRPDWPLLLIGGGTGIAPLRSIMWAALESGATHGITVIYSARAPEEFAFLPELFGLESDGRIVLRLTVTRASDETWTGSRGRIDRAMIASTLTSRQTRCFVCGPAPFVADVTGLLIDAGVDRDSIGIEAYRE
jgi:ferredoxin-NADP reductase